ncbi:cytochrome c biogenesis protein ResB [Desulfobulbus alkaliphilus]|uniref:cytochrome c biogenesis protein ResB n=1 Tax=Desulfobulbus alkaliphilus TaxID=869814 RepID=UPI0019660E7F|nr:cytochrome c biogenesis protein ResB [Desulfobulbus alkaliphilus]MBM9535511.1 cytochrome c biogenesis protein ResB [Desulfobulbus alkaliphilus]
MTSKKKNPVIDLLASVQLALFLIFLLASTSIIGTLIPQNNPPSFYIQAYGEKAALIMQLLHIPDMYNSWWFLTLLAVFALNLTVCSLERIPRVIRTIRKDGLSMATEQVEKLPIRQERTLAASPEEAAEHVAGVLRGQGWQARTTDRDNGRLFFAEKEAWSRFGVYIVHLSILVILIGALIGSPAVARKILQNPSFAFKGSVMIPESQTIEQITAFKTRQRLDLGFALRLDSFLIEHYPNGMPKTYRSSVTIFENGQPAHTADIEVNTPLIHRGITFYQASYQPLQNFIIGIRQDGRETDHTEIVAPERQRTWQEAGVSYGILNLENRGEVTQRLKIWFTDNQGEPAIFWLPAGQEARIERPSGVYHFQARQMYASGLQVAKDPGVWVVYTGCLLMLIGLYIAFFRSHRRIYVLIQPDGQGSRLLFAGTTTKNKEGLEKKMNNLASKLDT